jgi:lipopolysaccharide export system permease protein
MGIISQYLIRELIKFFLGFELAFVFIYLLIDFIQKIDNILEAGASLESMVLCFALKIPLIVMQMAPVAMLLSVIVLFSIMERGREITAFKACGISVLGTARPVIVFSLVVAVALFLFSELVVPFTTLKSNKIWNRDVEKRSTRQIHTRNNIWYRSQNAIYWIREFDFKYAHMKDVSLFFFNDSFKLIKRIDAQKGVWDQKGWVIQNGLIQELGVDGRYRAKPFEEISLSLPETPDDFQQDAREPSEMSYWELKQYAEKIQNDGYDATAYRVEKNIKLSFPIICFILVLIGIPIALRVKGGRIALAVAVGIGAIFIYLVTFGLTRSIGLSGILPPVFSAWIANTIFFLIGIYLLMQVNRS